MDFQELLDHADYNTTESRHRGNNAGIVKYSSVLPPPKKLPKANVQSENIRRFLEKKKREEEAKVAEAKKQKEQLLALRAQNTKNSKKAKIMASRTKDNDFSRIKLTDDEIEAKKKREAELVRKNLAGKVERMKARIEMEEKEKLLPKKRKRKSKKGEIIENVDNHYEDLNSYKESTSCGKNYDKFSSDSTKNIHKPPRPPPPNLNITELLKIAEKKQHEPMDVVIKKKEVEKLMTKKERKIMEEDLARLKRKQEGKLKGNRNSSKSLSSSEASLLNKTKTIQNSEKSAGKKSMVLHVQKDVYKPQRDESKFKIPKSGINMPSSKNVPINHKDSTSNSNVTKLKSNNSLSEKSVKSSSINGHKKLKSQDERVPTSQEMNHVKKVSVPKQNGLKVNKSFEAVKKSESQPKFDEEALTASLEKKIRDRLEKEIEEKLSAKIAQLQAQISKAPETPNPLKKEPVNNKKTVEKPSLNSKKEIERMNEEVKKKILEQRNNKPKLPEKKPFHKNPYLEPPRRLLEPQRPQKPPMKRRIESDDDDDDDDDDMSDFIDDGPSQNEEDYSKYIQEIFGYDRTRYEDIDDDDIKESTFDEQMKEEVRSAKLGYLEDKEEEKLELERMKKKKKKKK